MNRGSRKQSQDDASTRSSDHNVPVTVRDLVEARCRRLTGQEPPTYEAELWRRFGERVEWTHLILHGDVGAAIIEVKCKHVKSKRARRNRGDQPNWVRDLEVSMPGDLPNADIVSRVRNLQALHAHANRHLDSDDGRVCRRLVLSAAGEALDLIPLSKRESNHCHVQGKRQSDCVEPYCAGLAKLDQHIRSAHQYYFDSSQRRAAARYTGGILAGLVIVPSLMAIFLQLIHWYLGEGAFTDWVRFREYSGLAVLSGGLGALASVIQRSKAKDTTLDHEAAKHTKGWDFWTDPIFVRGMFRVVLGSLFAVVLVLIVQAAVLPIKPPDVDKHFFFFGVLGFLGIPA
jgi:hypothetical protein